MAFLIPSGGQMPIDRRSLLMFGGMCGLGFAPATARADTAGMPGLAVQAGSLPEKAVGTGAETLYVYLSLGCPSCANFHGTTLPELRRTLVADGRLRIVYREFPLDVRAFAAAMIARKAGDRYFDALDLMFSEQHVWLQQRDAGPTFRRLAAQVGVDKEAYDATMADRPLYDAIGLVKEQAKGLGVRGTPTMFIRSEKIEGDLPIDAIAARYAEARR